MPDNLYESLHGKQMYILQSGNVYKKTFKQFDTSVSKVSLGGGLYKSVDHRSSIRGTLINE